MPRKKGKSVSFDAMVKFFMQNYDIPTKKDVDKLLGRLDRLGNLIRTSVSLGDYRGRPRSARPRTSLTAFETVLDLIKRSKEGLGFAEIQAKTGFEDKKIRNIIFRLNRIGKIKRVSRGIYIAI
ncbi:MAG: hypothetical protein JSW39_17335 [Desulfobacterales bacterium]|nr:MAG: hypothetical protein JSW39_17335 [Desulfobacterales bacterium]